MTESRLSLVGSALADRKADSLVVSGLPNIRYLCGFTGENALLLVTPDTDYGLLERMDFLES